jgi:hypothetical protein
MYPLVNVYITNWKVTILELGKSTIFNSKLSQRVERFTARWREEWLRRYDCVGGPSLKFGGPSLKSYKSRDQNTICDVLFLVPPTKNIGCLISVNCVRRVRQNQCRGSMAQILPFARENGWKWPIYRCTTIYPIKNIGIFPAQRSWLRSQGDWLEHLMEFYV